jgi:formylglycine-generating enzyme required for sulfatase activity
MSASGAPVTFEWAHVGNPGNAADPQTGFGAVAYHYAISKHEVTNAQYAAFLNAVDPTGANTLALYNAQMASNFGGIEYQDGDTAGNKYALKAGRAQNPVTYVSFFDAMRFTNWLHNGQGAGDTEAGAYTIGSGLDEVRSASAKIWLPSENEWYKAAYHDATAGTAGVYFDYATGSDSVPVSDQPGDNPAAVNYYRDDDNPATDPNSGYAVSGSQAFPRTSNPFTDVGAYTAAVSPYGTFDQSGNVAEWNEPAAFQAEAPLRGGSWWAFYPSARYPYSSLLAWEFGHIGFRIATVPEPTTVMMLAVAGMSFAGRRR